MSLGKTSGGGGGGASSQSFIDPQQQQFLNYTNQVGQNLFRDALPGVQQAAGQLQTDLSNQGNAIAGSLQEMATGGGIVGDLRARGQMNNPFIGQQIAGLGQDIQRQLTQNLQGIGQGFASANQFGGGRQGLAEGQAIGRSIEEFSQQAAGLRAGDLDRQLAALGAAGGLQQGAAQTGLGSLGSRFNLGLAGFGAPLELLGGLDQIIGDPTVLSTMQQGSRDGVNQLNAGII